MFRPLLVLSFVVAAVAAMPVLGDDSARPRLVVVVVVDQLRGDYLGAFEDYFCEGGFRRLMRQGAWFSRAFFEYGATATGPGHATVATGSNPSEHGVVGNDWIEPATNQQVYCCGDEKERSVGGNEKGGQLSPRPLLIDTLGDRLKETSRQRGKVWGLSCKDRGAILSAGRKADGALWLTTQRGELVTSTYYGSTLPDWAADFNKSRYVDRYFGTSWELLLSESVYRHRPYQGVSNDEAFRRIHSGQFPKPLGAGMSAPGPEYYGALVGSPFGNEVLFEAARRLIEAEKLGTDDDTDLVAISLSSNDLIGHLYGPDSAEVMDCTLRTDRQLAEFLDWLDKRVGLDRCLVALSSDHGVGPIAEYSAELGLGGGRLDINGIVKEVEKRLTKRFGEPAKDAKYVRGLLIPWLYLNEQTLRDREADLHEACRIAMEVASQFEGVAAAFSQEQILSADFASGDELRLAVRNSCHPGRSGHVYIHWQKYWYKGKKLAGHGAAHDYDQHVPVLIMGPGIAPGRYDERVSPTGMTPTLCRLLGIDPPKGATGKVYETALQPAVAASVGN